MSEELILRPANAADLAFLVDSNAAMALETEGKALDHKVLERGVLGVFERPQRGFYLVAEDESGLLGCLLVTYEWSDWRNGDWWWLQSVYVIPEARRRGVFRALHAAVAQRARTAGGVVGLRLYVERDNANAQHTYFNLGMHETVYRLLEKPHAPSDEDV